MRFGCNDKGHCEVPDDLGRVTAGAARAFSQGTAKLRGRELSFQQMTLAFPESRKLKPNEAWTAKLLNGAALHLQWTDGATAVLELLANIGTTADKTAGIQGL